MALFDKQTARKPDHYPKASEFISLLQHNPWTADEFNFMSDLSDFKTRLTPQEQQMVVRALALIGQIEVSVKTFWGDLGSNLPQPSIIDLGYTLANNEVVHNRAYEKLLNILQLDHVFEEILQLPIIKGRVEYLRKHLEKTYDDDKKQYIQSVILFSIFIERVSLFTQFFVILWLRRKMNVLKDTAQQVEYTRNEELIHANVGFWLTNVFREEYPEYFDDEFQEHIEWQAKKAIMYEEQIIDWMIGDYHKEGEKDDDHINADIVKSYMYQCMNDSMASIGFNPVATVNPEHVKYLLWMEEELMGVNMVDFFHTRPKDYAKNNKVYNAEAIWND